MNSGIDQGNRIDYPCKWEYRIIAESREIVENRIFDILHRPYHLEMKNQSRHGRFISMHLITEVKTEADRNQIFQSLQQTPGIKMVL